MGDAKLDPVLNGQRPVVGGSGEMMSQLYARCRHRCRWRRVRNRRERGRRRRRRLRQEPRRWSRLEGVEAGGGGVELRPGGGERQRRVLDERMTDGGERLGGGRRGVGSRLRQRRQGGRRGGGCRQEGGTRRGGSWGVQQLRQSTEHNIIGN